MSEQDEQNPPIDTNNSETQGQNENNATYEDQNAQPQQSQRSSADSSPEQTGEGTGAKAGEYS